MLSLFFSFVSERCPSLIGDQGFLTSPGLAMRPRLEMRTDYTTLIYFTGDLKHSSTKDAVSSLKEALKPYKEAEAKKYMKFWQPCEMSRNLKKHVTATIKYSCVLKYRELTGAANPDNKEKCTDTNHFGYTDGHPCVLVRINKIYDWKPIPYTSKQKGWSPSVDRTFHQWRANSSKTKGELIYLDCFGVDAVDQSLLGEDPFIYLPQAGFPVNYFPYLNQHGYLQPAVFIKFRRLPPNVAIKVQCRIWAKNVAFDSHTWEGGFHFEILYDKKK